MNIKGNGSGKPNVIKMDIPLIQRFQNSISFLMNIVIALYVKGIVINICFQEWN